MAEETRAHPHITYQAMREWSNVKGSRASLPYLTLTIGTDRLSSGVTVVAFVPSGGDHPTVDVLSSQRWQDAPQSTEELVRVAVMAMRWIQDARGWDRD